VALRSSTASLAAWLRIGQQQQAWLLAGLQQVAGDDGDWEWPTIFNQLSRSPIRISPLAGVFSGNAA